MSKRRNDQTVGNDAPVVPQDTQAAARLAQRIKTNIANPAAGTGEYAAVTRARLEGVEDGLRDLRTEVRRLTVAIIGVVAALQAGGWLT